MPRRTTPRPPAGYYELRQRNPATSQAKRRKSTSAVEANKPRSPGNLALDSEGNRWRQGYDRLDQG